MKKFPKKQQTNRGAAGGELILVAAIVLVLGVLWTLSGGPERAETRSGLINFSSNNDVISRIDSFFIPITGDSTGTDTQSQADEIYDEIIEEFGRTRDFGENSPYWGLITIERSSSGPRQTNLKEEYVALDVSHALDEPLTITGWKLQSMITNEIVVIPEATKVSTSGNVNIEQPIAVFPEDKIYLLTGHSPVGNSFQINKCSGYFEQFQDFTPSISEQCPTPEDEFEFSESDPLRFGDACLLFIDNMDRCRMQLDALPLGFSNSCALFITEEINYSSCVENHRNDDDFFEPEWRVYLKHEGEIWNRRDIIRLLDNNDKTVDVFSY